MASQASGHAAASVPADVGDRRPHPGGSPQDLRHAKRLGVGQQWARTPDNAVLDHFELAARFKALESQFEQSMYHVHDVFMDHAQLLDDVREQTALRDPVLRELQGTLPEVVRGIELVRGRSERTDGHVDVIKLQLEAQLISMDARIETVLATVNVINDTAEGLIKSKIEEILKGSGPEIQSEIQAEVLQRVRDFEGNVMANLKESHHEAKKFCNNTVDDLKNDLEIRMTSAADKLADEFATRDGTINSLITRLDELSKADPLQGQDPWKIYHNIGTPQDSPQKATIRPSSSAGTHPAPITASHSGGHGQGHDGGHGPWGHFPPNRRGFGGHGSGPGGSRGPGGPGGPPGGGAHMTGVPGQGHQLSLYSKVFEDKVAQESKNQFNGSSDSGPTWRIFTRNYLMGTMPEVKALLKWAEERQHAKIEYDDLIALNETRMLDNCAVVMSHHVWRYLNLNLTGGAKTIHTNTDESNGLEVWRKLTLDITSRSAARRKLLHDQVYNPKHRQFAGREDGHRALGGLRDPV